MKKGICLFCIFFVLSICTGAAYMARRPVDGGTGTEDVPAVYDGAQADYLINARAPGETIDRVQIDFYTQGATFCIARTGEKYSLEQPVECEIPREAVERYIEPVFEMETLGPLATEELTDGWAERESGITVHTSGRTVTLYASATRDAECAVTDAGSGQTYRVKAQEAAWRDISVQTLTGNLFYPRRPEEVCGFDMYTPDDEYHFIRAGEEVTMNGETADATDFERMMQKLFEMPYVCTRVYRPVKGREKVTLRLAYEDAGSDGVSIRIEGEEAILSFEDGTALSTDTWRVNALAIACAGIQVQDLSQ